MGQNTIYIRRIKSGMMERIKHDRNLAVIYRKLGSLAINILKQFVKTDDRLILFNSFGGKKYDDSPKVIYELMKADERFLGYELVWAFHEPEKFPQVTKALQADSLQYFIMSLRARCWITNSAIQRGLVYKGKHTFALNTWHGTPLKRMGYDVDSDTDNGILGQYDVILAQSEYEAERMSSAYRLPRTKFRVYGLPRNDFLGHVTEDDICAARDNLGIPREKRVILYAPTFRDYQVDENSRCMMDIPVEYDYWEKRLGQDTVILLRMHYEVARHTVIPDNQMWKDVSEYPVLNDLMVAADILITDYSSIMFDYSILGRPIFCLVSDYEEYQARRGMYFDVREELSWASDGNTMVDMIAQMDEKRECEKCRAFREKYVDAYGKAGRRAVECIYENL